MPSLATNPLLTSFTDVVALLAWHVLMNVGIHKAFTYLNVVALLHLNPST
jgi:hypothetical protein